MFKGMDVFNLCCIHTKLKWGVLDWIDWGLAKALYYMLLWPFKAHLDRSFTLVVPVMLHSSI